MQDVEALFGISDQIANARSFIFVPAGRPERFDNAFSAGAYMVIINLEDAVAVPSRAAGRDHIKSYLTAADTALILINGTGSAGF